MGQLDKALLFAEQHSQGIYHLMSQEARTRVGVCVCVRPLSFPVTYISLYLVDFPVVWKKCAL